MLGVVFFNGVAGLSLQTQPTRVFLFRLHPTLEHSDGGATTTFHCIKHRRFGRYILLATDHSLRRGG